MLLLKRIEWNCSGHGVGSGSPDSEAVMHVNHRENAATRRWRLEIVMDFPEINIFSFSFFLSLTAIRLLAGSYYKESMDR